MKQIICKQYGPPEVLQIVDVPMPEPGERDVLIKVKAFTVSAGDWRVRSLSMPPGFAPIARLALGFSGPRNPVLGADLAGEVVAVGSQVSRFKVGDAVLAFTGAALGGYSEYRCLPETAAIVHKPDNLAFDEAAAILFGGMTALCSLRKADIRTGETVLVNGATGAVGAAAVQLARQMGARVSAVCGPGGMDLVKSLGAELAIDYTRTDFAELPQRYDVIVDCAGTAPYARSRRALQANGRLLLVLGGLGDLLKAPWMPLFSKQRIIAGLARVSQGDLQDLVRLAEQGEVRAVIDRRYPFAQIVEAHRYLDTGRKKGSIVMLVDP
ncbi:NAD(P)-dependent alcohol dehydrogenase [Chitinimonas sp.]|uniref:NAD(P)-dependent alcohol dehydrogenase n=1 Tax=Chitinimonas sp. TaxID=1934313 RepID=UPI0035AE0225